MFLEYISSLTIKSLQKNEVPDMEIVAYVIKSYQPYSTIHSFIFGIRSRYHADGQAPHDFLLNFFAQTSILNSEINICSSCKKSYNYIFGLLSIVSDRET